MGRSAPKSLSYEERSLMLIKNLIWSNKNFISKEGKGYYKVVTSWDKEDNPVSEINLYCKGIFKYEIEYSIMSSPQTCLRGWLAFRAFLYTVNLFKKIKQKHIDKQ